MAIDGTKVTMAQMRKGVPVDTGIRHTFVVEFVQVYIEWPEDLVRRLPDDFVLTLTVAGEPKQKLRKSAAIPADGQMMRFEFEWDDKTKSVKLEASGKGQTILLWSDHVAGDLSADLAWDAHLDPLLAPRKDVEVEGEAVDAEPMSVDVGYGGVDALLREML